MSVGALLACSNPPSSSKANPPSSSKAWVVSTLAGDGTADHQDGRGTAAKFDFPAGLAVDSSMNIYVADFSNNRIRKITAEGVVSTLAGDATAAHQDGTGTAARFNNPADVAVDSSMNIYVADFSNNRIRKITAAGVVSTLAGGTAGHQEGPGAGARFNEPYGVAVDSSGHLYVADSFNHRIRKITPEGVVSTLAGDDTRGHQDGRGAGAKFHLPYGVAVDSSMNIYVADFSNNRIRKITPAGVVSTLAGDGTRAHLDGRGTAAQFHFPTGLAVDSSMNIYVADFNNHRIRKITAAGVVSTLAGDGTAAQFSNPFGVAVDSSMNIYVADTNNHRIRKITPAGVVSTLAGDGTAGHKDGRGTAARFDNPRGVAVDSSMNIYVADFSNNRIRKITAEGVVSTLAGDATRGHQDGMGAGAKFNEPIGLAVDSSMNIYVADQSNHRIRKIVYQ